MISACVGGRPRSQIRAHAPRTLVIGAGFAGLATAYELASAGVEVAVLEARARVGGRVLSFGDFVEQRVVEGGGELVGANHPIWNAYKDRFGLEFHDVTEDENLELAVVLNGRKLSNAQARALYDEMEAALSSMNLEAAQVDPDEPWRSPGAQRLDQRTSAQWIDALQVSPDCKRALRVQLTADNGMVPERQSYLAQLAMVRGGGLEAFWTESEVFRCRAGNQELARRLAGELGSGRVLLGKAVSEIRSNPDGARVCCSDGSVFEADEVVLAIPPSTWSRVRFDPPLPASLAPQLGDSVKFLTAVRRRFWLDDQRAADALTDGDVSMLWESTDGQPEGGGASLCAFSSGPAAQACRARVGAAQRAAYRDAIEALLPGCAREALATRFMDWRSDAWTACGYSFPAPGEVTSLGPLWRAGLGRLHFAGEHTSSRFPGYMEGALDSGARVARVIAGVQPGVRKMKYTAASMQSAAHR